MRNPFTWERLTTPPLTDEVFDPASWLYLAFFGFGFLAAAWLSGTGAERVARHPVTRRMLRRDGAISLWVFGAGLFFFGVRALGINPFSFGAPIWLWLCLALLIVLVGYFLVYARRTYPRQLQGYEQQRAKQQYLKPSGKGAGSRRAAMKKGGPASPSMPLSGRNRR